MDYGKFLNWLENVDALSEIVKLVKKNKWSFEGFYYNCQNGGYILYVFEMMQSVNSQNEKKYILTKALCAQTITHISRNETVAIAINTAIAYGRGECSKLELQNIAAETKHYAQKGLWACEVASRISWSAYGAVTFEYNSKEQAGLSAYDSTGINVVSKAAFLSKYIKNDISAIKNATKAASAAAKEQGKITSKIVRENLHISCFSINLK